MIAAGVDLGGSSDSISGFVYFPDDGRVAYSRTHLHGSDLYYVPQDEVMQHYGAVQVALQEALDRNEDTPFVRGFKAWQALDKEDQTIQRLLIRLKHAQVEEWGTTNVYRVVESGGDEIYFWERWQRLKWKWANYVFEWVFLSVLALFIAWPGIRGPTRFRWAAHIGLFPILFMLPVYLGYAVFSFTSAGLSGGIVYPYLLRWTFGGRCTAADRWLLAHLPQVLEPLSLPIGGWVSLSGRGMPGPTSAIRAGMIAAVSIIAAASAWQWWRGRKGVRTIPKANIPLE